MQGVNSCTLVGNIGNDPELSYTQSGTAILKLRVAVNERVKRGDEWTDHTEWFSVVIWHKRAEALAKLLAKGSAVFVEGPMRHRSYEDRNGATRDQYELNAQNVILLGERRRDDADRGADRQPKGDGNRNGNPQALTLPDRERTPIATAETAKLERWKRRLEEDLADPANANHEVDMQRTLAAIAAELERRGREQRKGA